MSLSACPSRTAVPQGSSVLRGSGSSRWGHLSQVGAVFFLSLRSYRRLSLLLVGLVPGLCDGVSCLRSGLCSSACDRNEGYPSFWWDWLWAFAVGSPFSGSSVRGGFPHLIGTKALPMHLLCIPSGGGHPLGQVCLFVTRDHERRLTLVVIPSQLGHPF